MFQLFEIILISFSPFDVVVRLLIIKL